MSTFRVQTSPLYPDEEFHFSRLYVQLLFDFTDWESSLKSHNSHFT